MQYRENLFLHPIIQKPDTKTETTRRNSQKIKSEKQHVFNHETRQGKAIMFPDGIQLSFTWLLKNDNDKEKEHGIEEDERIKDEEDTRQIQMKDAERAGVEYTDRYLFFDL